MVIIDHKRTHDTQGKRKNTEQQKHNKKIKDAFKVKQQSEMITKLERIQITIWASARQNLSEGFPTKRDSNQSPQLQTLSKKNKNLLVASLDMIRFEKRNLFLYF